MKWCSQTTGKNETRDSGRPPTSSRLIVLTDTTGCAAGSASKVYRPLQRALRKFTGARSERFKNLPAPPAGASKLCRRLQRALQKFTGPRSERFKNLPAPVQKSADAGAGRAFRKLTRDCAGRFANSPRLRGALRKCTGAPAERFPAALVARGHKSSERDVNRHASRRGADGTAPTTPRCTSQPRSDASYTSGPESGGCVRAQDAGRGPQRIKNTKCTGARSDHITRQRRLQRALPKFTGACSGCVENLPARAARAAKIYERLQRVLRRFTDARRKRCKNLPADSKIYGCPQRALHKIYLRRF